MAGIYAERFAHLFDFRSLRAQTRIPPNPVLFSPYPALLNGPLVKTQCVPLSYFFFPCSSKQILHQVCKTCSSLTFLGPVLKVKALKSTGNLFPYFFKNPHGQKSFDRQLSPAMTMLQKLMGSDAYTDPAPAETNTPTCVLAISKSFWQNHID